MAHRLKNQELSPVRALHCIRATGFLSGFLKPLPFNARSTTSSGGASGAPPLAISTLIRHVFSLETVVAGAWDGLA